MPTCLYLVYLVLGLRRKNSHYRGLVDLKSEKEQKSKATRGQLQFVHGMTCPLIYSMAQAGHVTKPQVGSLSMEKNDRGREEKDVLGKHIKRVVETEFELKN